MDNDFTSAWLMYAIFHSQTRQLSDIIAVADYANHAIMTYTEFIEGLTVLQNLGVIVVNNNEINVSGSFDEWWATKFASKRSISVNKEISEMNAYISKMKSTMIVKTEPISFTVSDFDKAVKNYIDKFK